MAEEAAEPAPHPPPTFIEVKCRSSGKTRRFAVGTDAGFALSLINRTLMGAATATATPPPLALHIEAFKEREEPIAFGPNSLLVQYGHGWQLQTRTELDFDFPVPKGERLLPTRISTVKGTDGSHPVERAAKPEISFVYIGKIILAFILIFVLGVIFTLALENLPRLILFIKSSM
ncbi:uncharacterized protein LOC115953573 [Quercus lobata]|uniref:uncharacterized protein LOC115953573 n=1 Tax=Quercus lobata TaxID=97700 RepID=UPI00124777DA|nr:uncharacterized protein LOC115953573 [Quercus lobata]